MKKDCIIRNAIIILLMLISIVIAVYYLLAYLRHTQDTVILAFSLLGFAESLFSGLSLSFCWKHRVDGLALSIYAISVILAIPVLLVATVWLLYIAGLQLLPPPQR